MTTDKCNRITNSSYDKLQRHLVSMKKLGVSRYGKSVLRYIAIHDNRITIRIAIYCLRILLLIKGQINTEINLHVESCHPISKQSIPLCGQGALKWLTSLCEREVIQRIQGF